RRRSGCCFNGGGPGSALWKSVDGERLWTKISGNGLPPGTYGRIALDVSKSNPNVVYAQIEAGEVGQPMPAGGRGAPPTEGEATPPGAAAVVPPGAAPPGRGEAGRAGQAGRAGGTGQAAAQPGGGGGGGGRGGYNWCNNGGPGGGFGGGGGGAGGGGGGGPGAAPVDTTRKPPALSNQRPGLYRSENKGRTWTLVSNCNRRPLYFS